MIARHETHMDKMDIWSKLSAPLPSGVISWRQDGKPVQRDGKFVARFVAYIDAQTVRERLDSVVPGEWDLTLELLPGLASDGGEIEGEQRCSFKARLEILGVIREDVGTGRDYKAASTDAFKRAAVRFGIAHELYAYEQNWVAVDGDGRNAKPLEDPGVVYARRFGPTNGAALPAEPAAADAAPDVADAPARPQGSAKRARQSAAATAKEAAPVDLPAEAVVLEAAGSPTCPKCGGRMWDNRLSKRNPKAPDF